MTVKNFNLIITVLGPVENVPLTVEEHVEVPTQELTARSIREEKHLISATCKYTIDEIKIAQLLANKFELRDGEDILHIKLEPIEMMAGVEKPVGAERPNIKPTRQQRRSAERKGGKP